MKKRTWLWIAAGVVALVVVGLLAFAGVTAWIVMSHLEVNSVPADRGHQQIDAARARFAGKTPLIAIEEPSSGGRPRVTRRFPVEAARRPIDQIRVIAFDPDDGKLVRVDLPFWLVRLKGRGMVHISADDFDLDELNLTVDDLERYGPGLILDHRARDGTRVLVWAE